MNIKYIHFFGLFWIIFCILVKQISNFSIQNQLEISFDLIEALEIQHCIVASDLKEGSISDVKAYSERNIPIAYMNYNELYFGLAKRLQFRTGVILSGKEANDIQMLFRLIQLVRRHCCISVRIKRRIERTGKL